MKRRVLTSTKWSFLNKVNLKAETDGFQTATEIEQALKQHSRFKQFGADRKYARWHPILHHHPT